MKFTTELLKKAHSIARTVKLGSWKLRWSEGLKQAIRLFKALKTGIVRFWKMNGEETVRRIATLDSINYESKGGLKNNDPSLLVFVDLDKLDRKESNPIISFHSYQILA